MSALKRALAAIAAAIMLLNLAACGKVKAPQKGEGEYGGLFDTSFVHLIDVSISEADWEDLKANPLEKTKYKASVTIDGVAVDNVSFAVKGNTSFAFVASSDSDRYSFKINFGKFENGQTFFGLDKLNLNNLMSDATYMKDYLSYLIMRKAGAAAPLISYAQLNVNGSFHGLYIAVEEVEESFINRYFGDTTGALYKPETTRLANVDASGGAPQGGEMPQGTPPPGFPEGSGAPQGGGMPQGTPPPGFPEGSGTPQGGGMHQGGGMPGEDSGGADLVYKDDKAASYPAIFDNAETESDEAAQARLIAAIKALASGEQADAYWDMKSIARYFAAHNFVLNYDSYTGNMLHNYYLYERSGVVCVFPWDYNLAFGGFTGAGDAVSAVNTPICSPLSGCTEDQRPLWKAVVSNEEALAEYLDCYEELLSGFFENGECRKEIERVRDMIRPYVKKDPTAFYKVGEFDDAVKTLIRFCDLRAQSIRKQLAGELGRTKDTQKKEDMVSAEGLDISKMGVMGTNGGPQGGPGGPGSPMGPGGPGGAPSGSMPPGR